MTDLKTLTILTSVCQFFGNSTKRRQNYAHNFSGNFAGLKLIFAGVCCDVPAASSLRRLLGHVKKTLFNLM